jgi:uncharacterized protein
LPATPKSSQKSDSSRSALSNNTDRLENIVGPIRTCVGCRIKRAQADLVRVANVAGAPRVDRTASGRGAWLCRETAAACAARALKSKGFERTLRATFAAGVVADLVRSFEKAAENVAD